MSTKQWIPLESNPDILTRFGRALGLPSSLQFGDVYSLDLLDLTPSPQYAVLLLFPLTDKLSMTNPPTAPETSNTPPSYFCKQTIGNACGTIALLHAALHMPDDVPLVENSFLQRFKRDTKDMTPEERAVRLQDDEGLDAVHSEFAQQGQTNAPAADDKVDLHFVCFVEKDGRLFELDGRKDRPVDHGVCDGVLRGAAGVIQTKFMALDPTEHRFTILALCGTSE